MSAQPQQPSERKIVQQIEKDFQAAIVELAKLNGWLVYHTHDSRRSEPGFPDLVLVRERVLFWEVKTQKGRVLVRPSDWNHIEATLTRTRTLL